DELLTELCTAQRSQPYHAEHHSAINLASADYYDRLLRNGGHMSLMREEELKLAAEGWDKDRIAALRQIVELREDHNVTRFRPEVVDPKLRAIGFEPTDELRWMAQLVLYPAFRDAHLDAEASLQRSLAHPAIRSVPTPPAPALQPVQSAAPVPTAVQPHVTIAGVLPPESAIPEDWRHVTASEAAERFIAGTPKMFEHR